MEDDKQGQRSIKKLYNFVFGSGTLFKPLTFYRGSYLRSLTLGEESAATRYYVHSIEDGTYVISWLIHRALV